MTDARNELWQKLRDIEAEYDVVLGVWQKEDVVSAMLMVEGWDDENAEELAKAEEVANRIWTSEFKHGLRDAVNSPDDVFDVLVRNEYDMYKGNA